MKRFTLHVKAIKFIFESLRTLRLVAVKGSSLSESIKNNLGEKALLHVHLKMRMPFGQPWD